MGQPHHDKVEFEIVHSCYYLNLPNRLKELLDYGFKENEIKRIEFSLLELTNKIIHPEYGLYKQDLQKLQILEQKYTNMLASELTLVDKIYWLVEDCKSYGTLPFAGIARAAFIVVQFLRSFIELGIISEAERDAFMNSLFTVNKQMKLDLSHMECGEISKAEFLERYGHIRPGTYDILSKRYDEGFDSYFSLQENEAMVKELEFAFSPKQLKQIDEALILNGMQINARELIQFIRESIEGREYAKFLFTRSLSKVIQLIEEFGNRNGVSREELAYLDYAQMKDLYSTLDNRFVQDIFLADIKKNKELFLVTQAVKLPSVIIHPEDVYGFFLLEEEPNFVTLKIVRGELVDEAQLENSNLEGKIVCISSADPGYDFLFTKNIAGLITKYGGANSHMAIRCAELGIPAVIGAGETNFIRWRQAKAIEVHAMDKKVRLLDPLLRY